jgi:UDP-N-acetylmuramate: L-alanyl-gamma-D-glutamyl-meso-diaminopimelate ligase
MHVHILGICGTFMGGVAAIARAAGHRVTGSDRNVYPPMSDQLAALGIELTEGFDTAQLDEGIDALVVGNVMTRGMPVVEAMLDRRLPYVSGPEWLAQHVLRQRRVIAVAGTHGKTTTTSLLAWILDNAGLEPGFLIGGVPQDFDSSARLGAGEWFVIEADEYDTAFFDKRAKFLHYRPEICVINNLEFDHADIYSDLDAIQWQFHQLLRAMPGAGRLILRAGDANLEDLLDRGCWTPVERFASTLSDHAEWRCETAGNQLELHRGDELVGRVDWQLTGSHNAENALAAIAAASAAGVKPAVALEAVGRFRGVKRRLELRGSYAGVELYDDFAHHPTAISRTIAGLRSGGHGRLLVVFEPRSNTMRMGVHRDALANAFERADAVWVFAGEDFNWDLPASFRSLPQAHVHYDTDSIVAAVAQAAQPGDRLVVMSNGGFEGIHDRLAAALAVRS